MADQLLLEVVEVDVAVVILGDRHHVGNRLPPGNLIGVVFERTDEDHRSIIGGDRIGQVVPIVQRRWHSKAEDPDQPVDGIGRPAAAEHDGMLFGGPDAPTDDLPRLLAEPGCLEAGARRFGVRVGVTGQHHLPQVVLDEGQGATRRGVVGVDHGLGTERTIDHFIATDHRFPDVFDQLLGFPPRELTKLLCGVTSENP